MSELKPCPFCGEGKMSVLAVVSPNDDGWKWVHCSCGADGPPDLGESGAIEKWNTRPGERAAAVAGWEWWDNPEDDALCAEPTPTPKEAHA